jgi:hypothetical protein
VRKQRSLTSRDWTVAALRNYEVDVFEPRALGCGETHARTGTVSSRPREARYFMIRAIVLACLTYGTGRFNAFSAGSHPKGRINPFALKVLDAYSYPTEGFRSKGWDEFARPGAPELDFVFTVCDAAAGEACPVWPASR